MKSIDYIVTAKHYGGSARGYIRKMQDAKYKSGIAVQINGLNEEPTGVPVNARIWQGQWIADCEWCNGACFVDPDEPVFFCFGCGNRANGSRPRPVVFPEDVKKIEELILSRPVNDVAGLTDMERAGMSKPILFVEKVMTGDDGKDVTVRLPLARSWEPGESVEDLCDQQEEPIKKWKAAKTKDVSNGL